MIRRRTVPAAFAAVVALCCAAPADGGGPRKTVEVADNYYLPAKLTVNPGTRVVWRWPADIGIDVHDVKLESGPRGAKKFQSEPASSGYVYRRTLTAPGRYRIVCTLHEEMTMTIRVRR